MSEVTEQDVQNETYYSNYFELFSCAGWQQFVGELIENAKTLNNISAVKDGSDLLSRQGQLQILTDLINFEQLIDNASREMDKLDD